MDANFTSVRTGASANASTADSYVDGVLNGRVISLTSGVAEGYSTRIISQRAINGNQFEVVIPRDGRGINWAGVANDEVVINGREYSGTGNGALDGAGSDVYDPDRMPQARFRDNALLPNRVGESLADLVRQRDEDLGNGTILPAGVLSSDQSPNEPYDAPDPQNMHLSGFVRRFNDAGQPVFDIIPSFWRDRLYRSRLAVTGPDPLLLSLIHI